jgi:hypothetical protein
MVFTTLHDGLLHSCHFGKGFARSGRSRKAGPYGRAAVIAWPSEGLYCFFAGFELPEVENRSTCYPAGVGAATDCVARHSFLMTCLT